MRAQDAQAMPLPKILLISLGGTITMTTSAGGGIKPALTAADLVKSVPGLEQVAQLEAATPLQLPSPSLRLDDLLELARLLNTQLAGDIAGAVVVQGTDTIEETAFVLDLLVAGDKPVVVTGAMRGAQAAGADGPANLLAATIVAASPAAAGLGTLVCLNDEVHAARFVQKSHTALPSAFTSPLAGPLGLVVEGRALFHVGLERTPALTLPQPSADAPVALVKMALGDDGRMLKALPELQYRGCVLEGMGAGHVPVAVAPLVEELATRMPVVLGVRVHTGPALTRTYGFAGSEIDLLGRGALSAGLLSGLKARLLLALLLRLGLDRQTLEARFRQRTAAP
jgi:L-asparaginase